MKGVNEMKKHIIWTDTVNLNLEDYAEYLEENYPETVDDYKKFEIIDMVNSDELDMVRDEFDIQLDGRILILGQLGLWNGKVSGYKIINSGKLSDIFYSQLNTMSYMEFWSDGYNIRASEAHHDGTNYYLFREIREDKDIENFLNDIYFGREISRSKLNYYTRSVASHINKLYGWAGVK